MNELPYDLGSQGWMWKRDLMVRKKSLAASATSMVLWSQGGLDSMRRKNFDSLAGGSDSVVDAIVVQKQTPFGKQKCTETAGLDSVVAAVEVRKQRSVRVSTLEMNAIPEASLYVYSECHLPELNPST
jgi:hypothetical protein